MTLYNRWYSSESYILEFNFDTYTMRGKLYLPENSYSKDYDFCGVVSEDERNHEIAFIINWKAKNLISYTAFQGKINNEGTLLLNWLLSSQSLNSNKRESVSGSSIFTRSVSNLNTNQESSPSLPYPIEFQNTHISSNIFLSSEKHYLK
jgi:hypothetical protein